jgi:hypothetical protein
MGEQMPDTTTPEPEGWRVLGFGKHPEIAAAIETKLRAAGLRARNFALTNDDQGDAQLRHELEQATYDGVAIGGFINGQDPDDRPDAETTEWFNRVLNIIHTHAPTAKIILIRDPSEALPTINRILGAG